MIDVPPYDVARAAVWTATGVALGAAPEPPGGDDALHIVIDGRLDDRAALVKTLEGDRQGSLRHASDGDLVRAAYARWGTGCASYLLGDFSFCLWDPDRRQLFCARDHLGVKPLYFAQIGGTLVVSNVLSSLRRHPDVSAGLDDHAIGDLLLVGACMDPSRSAFADIARVPPAHTLTYSTSRAVPRVERYWSLEPSEELRLRDPREYVERYVTVLETVVRDRIRDAHVGVLMSGGLDSSCFAAAATAVVGADDASKSIRAYTFVYDGVAEDEERRYSTLVARRLGIDIEHHPLDGYRWFERWDAGLLPPEPCTEPMTAMTADLFERVAGHSTVALTGDGGDPLFVPTTLVHLLQHQHPGRIVANLWRSVRYTRAMPPIGLRSGLRRVLTPAQTHVPAWLSEEFVRRCELRARSEELSHRTMAAAGPRGPAARAITDFWWTSIFETYDSGATQRPVELRYPLFDLRFIAFALSLPTHPWCLNKTLVRSAMRGRLPEEICSRPKSPLAVDLLRTHGHVTVADVAGAIEAVPGLTAYIDVGTFRATVRDDRVMTDAEPGTWAALALATWMRCAGRAGVAA